MLSDAPAIEGRKRMAELPRLNGVVGALEKGRHALTTFTPADVEAAIALATAKYDAVVYEMEHNAYDIRAFRDCLQYMLNRRQIAQAGSLAPAVAPFARIPPNSGEKAQFHAKQVLDLGAYGIIWPHISTVDQAYNAVAACRYPRRWADAGGSLLGIDPAGILRARRRVAAQSQGRDLRHSDDRGHGRHQQSEGHPEKRAGHRRDPDRRGRSFARARLSAAIRAQGRARGDGADRQYVQRGQCRRRPSACRNAQCRARRQGRLSLPDVRAGAQLRQSRQSRS